MNTQHTPTRWVAEGSNVWQENGFDVDQSNIATTHGPNAEANARRIVACVNACEGINPEAVPELLEWLKYTCNLLDRLPDLSVCDRIDAPGEAHSVLRDARAAIAKAKTL